MSVQNAAPRGTGPIAADVAILGTGFSGSVLAVILARQGVRVALVDGGTHPRFALGESTVPHTSLMLSILAERWDVPEIEHLAFPDRIARHVCATCGIKRTFGFAYHRERERYDPAEALQFGTSSKDENHLFRQDVDAWLFHLAVRHGATPLQQVRVEHVAVDEGGVTLSTAAGEVVRARYVVDAGGEGSLLARLFDLREDPPSLRHASRTLFTHMIDVGDFAEPSPMSVPWRQSTLHHVFDGGWFWVIPFDNREGSLNPLVSVGLTLAPDRFPRHPGVDPDDEFRSFAARFPAVHDQFRSARAVRPWVSTGRLQYMSRRCTGYRFCLMSHAAGAVDALFSRGLINTLEVINALVEPLLGALEDDDFGEERFLHVDGLQERMLRYNDRVVHHAFVAFRDFDLLNAWLRIWALGTIITEFRLLNVIADYTRTRDRAHLRGSVAEPIFSDFEDPDYRACFERAAREMEEVEAGRLRPADAGERIFGIADEYPIPVLLTREGMLRGGWMGERDVISDRSLEVARSGYRWALANPACRDLIGNAATFYRWRARQTDPHLVAAGASPTARRSDVPVVGPPDPEGG